MSERRRQPRYPVDIPVRCRVGEESFPGRLKDICRDAALVEAHRLGPLDSRMALSLELPGAGAVEVTGRVIRHAAGEGDARGMAVLFSDLTPATATRIDLFLSSISGA